MVYMSKSSSLLISTVRSGLSALNISKEDSGKVIVIFSEVVLPVLAKAIQEGAVVEKARYGKKEKRTSVSFFSANYTRTIWSTLETHTTFTAVFGAAVATLASKRDAAVRSMIEGERGDKVEKEGKKAKKAPAEKSLSSGPILLFRSEPPWGIFWGESKPYFCRILCVCSGTIM